MPSAIDSLAGNSNNFRVALLFMNCLDWLAKSDQSLLVINSDYYYHSLLLSTRGRVFTPGAI